MFRTLLFIIAFSISYLVCGQESFSIHKCLDLINFELKDYNLADTSPSDTILDVKNGYFEVSYDYAKLCQVTYFKNADKSFTVLSTGYYSDQQCFNYFSYFHHIPSSTDTSIRMEQISYLPELQFEDFFVNDTITKMISKYLPEINANYLPNGEGSIQDVINEIYNYHIILPRQGKQLIVELTLCDYIPTNVVSISEEDWAVFSEFTHPVYLHYNKKSKKFERK